MLTTDSREHDRDYQQRQPGFGTAPEALLQGFTGIPELEAHILSCAQQPMQSLVKIAPNIFFHSLHVPQIGWLRTGYQGCIRAVRKKLKEIQPDIVHGQGTERDCGISAVFSGFPNVLTIHGNMRLIEKIEHPRPFSFWWLAARLEAFTLPRSQGVVCITHYTRDAVAGLARKTWVVPNAVNAGFFEVRPELHPEDPPLILCVGAICLRKNQNAFIRALDPLAAQRKFRLLFLGVTTPNDPYCRNFFKLVRHRPWCGHAGFVDRETLKLRLREAALLALPSLEDNCPMAVLEAAAASVPVVAANVGGVSDLIEDGKTGLLCDPQNADSMSRAVGTLLTQSSLARTLAEEANRRARERFHPVIIARRHLEIYREVLDRKKG